MEFCVITYCMGLGGYQFMIVRKVLDCREMEIAVVKIN
jgi:hypothetical protein